MTKDEYVQRLEADGYDTPKLWKLILTSDWICAGEWPNQLKDAIIADNRVALQAVIERLIALEAKR